MMDRSGAMSIPVAGLITAGTARYTGPARGRRGRLTCTRYADVEGDPRPGGPGAGIGRMAIVVAARLEIATVLRPVRAGNAFEETVERLLTVIKLGVVGPGERFPSERDLAAQLGISRITLREAIRELQQAGFIESRRGRSGGTFVTYRPPTPSRDALRRIVREDADNLTDALTFRMAVETGAAQLLAQNAGRASPDDYRRLDTLFHLSIAELTGSTLLAAACADARMRLNDLLNAIPVLKRNIDHTAGQHAAIVDAILAGDAELARRAVAEHLEGTGALLRGFLA